MDGLEPDVTVVVSLIRVSGEGLTMKRSRASKIVLLMYTTSLYCQI